MKNLKSEAEKIAKSIVEGQVSKIFEEKIMMSTPKAYVQKTEALSGATKEAHDALYRRYIEDFNRVQLELQSASRKTNYLGLRTLYQNRNFLLNAIKLHELYFSNISDLSSEISDASIAYTKLSECFGTFAAWQEDFIAACLTSREGWGICYYDPYLKTYTNTVIDLHDTAVPVGCCPVVVMDMWSHAYFHDYGTDKKSYVYNMMKELNWDIIEARFEAGIAGDLNAIFALKPIQQSNNTITTPTAVNFEELPVSTFSTPPGPPDPNKPEMTPQPTSPMFEELSAIENKFKKIVLG